MRIVWITRSFSDYRIPVFRRLAEVSHGGFTLLYSREVVPPRVVRKVEEQLGPQAQGLTGEWRFPQPKVAGLDETFANTGRARVYFQPGLARRIRALQPEVMITDGFFRWTPCALRLRAIRRIPHVMCYERTPHTERRAQWYRTAYRRLALRWIDAMCCNGQLCGQYVRSLGYPEDRITYGHMVADVEGLRRTVAAVTPAQTSALRRQFALEGLVFLYVGRLTPRKGLWELLHAWEVFSRPAACGPATLLLVGDGEQRAELEQICAARRLINVQFAGARDYDDLGPFYWVADAFIIPTLEDNWSLVVPEAMACGLPILCSQYNGCWPEYVTPANGWVFDPLDIADTCVCLQRCFQARERLPEMGRCSQEIASRHTATEAAEAILEACRIALRRRHQPEQVTSARARTRQEVPERFLR